MNAQPLASEPIARLLQAQVPGLLAIYAFGSRVQGTAGPDSDLDLAVLVAGYADPVRLWQLAGDLAAWPAALSICWICARPPR